MEDIRPPHEETRVRSPEEKRFRVPSFIEKCGWVKLAVIAAVFVVMTYIILNAVLLQPETKTPVRTPQYPNIATPHLTTITTRAPSLATTQILQKPNDSVYLENLVPTPQIEIKRGWKIYKMPLYQISIPEDYDYGVINESIYKSIYFKKVTEKGYNEKSITITSEATAASDPCTDKPEGYPNAYCTTINAYKVLDWQVDNSPGSRMGPIEFSYTFNRNGMSYNVQFLGVEKTQKDEVISTLEFTR